MTTNEEYIKKNKVITIDDDNNTKLHYAAAIGCIQHVQKQLATGQKVDPENYLGWTPLMMAVRNGHAEIVDLLLLEHRADASRKNKFDMNVFLISVTSGKINIVEKVLNHLLCGGVSRRSLQKTLSPISLSILFGHAHIFMYLLERSFDINMPTSLTSITPLMFSAAMGNHQVYRKLIHSKADARQKNLLGRTAPEILQSRKQGVDVGNACHKQKTAAPFIVITSPNGLQFQLTPNQTGLPTLRRSSNLQTPSYITPPGISPITPHFVPQMFFPPDFSPNHFISPIPVSYQSYHLNEVLEANINQSVLISPQYNNVTY